VKLNVRYPCPVCAYPLEHPPADFNICPSCGVEFGYSDAGRTYGELRDEWLKYGARWSSTVEPPPIGWNPYLQILPLLPLLVVGTQDFNSVAIPSHAAAIALAGEMPVLHTTAPKPDMKTIRSGTQRLPLSPFALEASRA
jgi:hypothetical protein